jgi:hypothetical protein
MRSISIPSLSHQTESFGTGEGNTIVSTDGLGQAELVENGLKYAESVGFLGGGERFAGEQVATGKIGDRQRIAIAPIGKHELALVVGAPKVIGLTGKGKCCSGGPVAPPHPALDQAMAIENRVDRTDGWGVHIRIEPRELVPDLRRAPARLVLLEAHDLRLDLERQLVGVPIGPARAIREPVQADLVVAREDLVAGLTGDAELGARHRHLLPVQQSSNELQTLIHGFTHLPGHLALPAKGPIV